MTLRCTDWHGNPDTGCEAFTDGDPDHCGSCDNACTYANATATCSMGQCELGNCAPGFFDCDGIPATGCEVDLQNDPQNCGGCGNDCANVFPNSQTTCALGVCHTSGCQPGHYDLDGNPANGCEYACNFQSATDLPDDNFTDENCDGIDGDVNAAIFVAKNGDDSFPGTRQQPMLTINNAIGRAVSRSLTEVYISQGTYTERVILANGVSLYGGYSSANNWARSNSYTVTISQTVPSGGRLSAVEGTAISQPTVLDRLTIQTGDTAQAGVSNYAMYCARAARA